MFILLIAECCGQIYPGHCSSEFLCVFRFRSVFLPLQYPQWVTQLRMQLPACFLKQLQYLALSQQLTEMYLVWTLSTLGAVSHLSLAINRCELRSHCAVHLHLPDNWWFWVSVMLIHLLLHSIEIFVASWSYCTCMVTFMLKDSEWS